MSPTISMDRVAAADALASLSPDVWYDLAEKMTCSEVEAVAAFLTAYGMDGDGVIAAHSTEDDEGDSHEPVYDDNGPIPGLLVGFKYREFPED